MSSLSSPVTTDLPPVDQHLVASETEYELDDGKLVTVSPALEPHAHLHATLAALLQAHVADGFLVAVDMLTRISLGSDRAPDVSVYPRARDPRTGGRQLEHLAFEIISSESLGHAAAKASGLSARGVRRIFAVDIDRARVFEWAAPLDSWSILDLSSAITDPALAVPLPLSSLLQVARTDDSIAAALLAKHNPVLEAFGRDQRAAGRAESILLLLAARSLTPSAAERAQILAERDLDRLARWLASAATCASPSELLAIA